LGFIVAQVRCIIEPVIYGYASISTDGQSADAQVKQLRAAKVYRGASVRPDLVTPHRGQPIPRPAKWRRYADAPAATLLTGLGLANGLRAAPTTNQTKCVITSYSADVASALVLLVYSLFLPANVNFFTFRSVAIANFTTRGKPFSLSRQEEDTLVIAL